MKTSKVTDQNHIQQKLFAGDFLASQFQTRASAKGSQRLQNLVCGTNSTESFAYYDRDTSCWKTSQQSFLEDLASFSETWPRQAIVVNMRAYQRHILEPVTRGTGFGLLPTPRAAKGMEMRLSKNMAKLEHKKYLETEMAARIHTHGETHLMDSKEVGENGVLNPSFVELLMGFPLGWTELKD